MHLPVPPRSWMLAGLNMHGPRARNVQSYKATPFRPAAVPGGDSSDGGADGSGDGGGGADGSGDGRTGSSGRKIKVGLVGVGMRMCRR